MTQYMYRNLRRRLAVNHSKLGREAGDVLMVVLVSKPCVDTMYITFDGCLD